MVKIINEIGKIAHFRTYTYALIIRTLHKQTHNRCTIINIFVLLNNLFLAATTLKKLLAVMMMLFIGMAIVVVCRNEKKKNYIHTWPKGIFFSFLIVGSFLCFYYFFRQVGVEILCVIFISLTKTKFSITEKKNLPLSWIPSLDLKFTNSFFFFCKISIQNFLHFLLLIFFLFLHFFLYFFRSFGRQRKILFYLTHTQIFYVFFNINLFCFSNNIPVFCYFIFLVVQFIFCNLLIYLNIFSLPISSIVLIYVFLQISSALFSIK